MALTKDIKTDRYGTPDQAPPMMAQPMDTNVKVYGGSIAITRSGYVNPASSPQSTDVAWGVVSQQTDNTTGSFFGGAQAAVQCPIDRGSFWLSFASGITQADVDALADVVDEQTVSKTAGSLPICGTILAVDTVLSKVAVAIGVVNKGAAAASSL